ncbi:MAG: AMP-binding protein, partial [Mailhella sp.]|nr:AMP-binding protein [Mailhella sp.]
VADKALGHKWWMRSLSALTDTVFLDFSSPAITASMARMINARGRCMVFREGRLSNDARYLRILESAALIAEKTGATLLPVRLEGAAFTVFSYMRHRVRRRLFPQVKVAVLPGQHIGPESGDHSRAARKRTGVRLYGIMSELEYRASMEDRNLLQLLYDTVSIRGRKFAIAEDENGTVLTYGKMTLGLSVLGHAFRRIFAGEEKVGFLLPTSLPGLVAFFALHAGGFVPAMLNFTAGASTVVSCCGTVRIRYVLTSRKFIKLGGLEPIEDALREAGLDIVYLEDVAKCLRLSDKLSGFLASRLKRAPSVSPDSPAAVMFTSGTEGVPKAVLLSHRNINANRQQALSVLTVGAGDKLFNCLPMFHAFGLGICTLLPVLAGVRVFLYPSPLQYRIVPKLFYESQSTILCGTDTFCSMYSRYGRPYDFCHARLVIIGAEKMRDATRTTWHDHYGVDLCEGYGATEAAPLIAVNTPACTRAGSVGRVVPGIEWKLKPVPGIEEENTGVLWVKGDNIMLGYMRAAAPGVLEPPRDEDMPVPEGEGAADEGRGWYDTGDIVHIDDDGFVFIRGRAKRFAKIGGEMISLAAVEDAIKEIWPESTPGVVSIPDPRKGEQLALIIDAEDVITSRIAAYFASRGISPLWTPKRIITVKHPPLRGSGKFDYRAAKELVVKGTA